ncbi:MAG: hypothetical protein ABR968_08215 [Bacteroidales bacterium]
MNKKSILLFFQFIIILFIISCKKDTVPVVQVTPLGVDINAKPGDIITFNIYVNGGNDELTKFIIQKQPENKLISTVLDTSINTKKFYYTYQYYIPDTITGSVFITFTAYNQNGDMGESATRVIISSDTILLTEYAGDAIYSRYSGKPDALNISTNTVQFSATASHSLLDIADYDTIPSDSMLSKQWYSPAGNKFVRFNGFDYANASNQSAIAAYNAGQKLDIVSNLSVNDIIITKVNSANIYAVIKITNIIDSASTINERYEFNLKK